MNTHASPASAEAPDARTPRRSGLRSPVLIVGIAVVVLCWCFRDSLRARILEEGVLANDSPPAELVGEMIKRSSHPSQAIRAAWDSGKIVHRQASMRTISEIVPPPQKLPADLESLLFAGALDPDLSVREIAMDDLFARNNRRLPALAAAQLHDIDPEIRILALTSLRRVNSATGVPIVITSLDDSNPLIATMALKLLEGWTGEDFGVLLAETHPVQNRQTGRLEFRGESRTKARDGVERAKRWWSSHQADYPSTKLEIPSAALAQPPIPAGDFQLSAIDGKSVRLSDLRGNVVLLSFWTTWCTDCAGTIPEFIALQSQHQDQLTVIGISLDSVPDDHAHLETAMQIQPSMEAVRQKVISTAKASGINYTVLLDENNTIGGRYKGGDLPATLIIDGQGWIRRRFIGPRSQDVLEAMIAEARQPLHLNSPTARN